jgi:catechol 2,3-dioxygenase-like lactoylglutathione lyase family enzyme
MTRLLTEISTVRVFCPDLPLSTAFYRDVLELPVQFEGSGYVGFATGQATLLLEAADVGDPNEPFAPRFLGVSFTAPDIVATYRALTARGVEFLHPPEAQSWGGVLTHFRDPAGNVLTAVQYERAAQS